MDGTETPCKTCNHSNPIGSSVCSDHNVGGHYMKELKDRSTIQYSINLRDAAFIKQGEVGFHFTNGMFLQQLQLNRRAN
jgi:hypothetical protein